MTRFQFNNVISHFANYQGKQVEFKFFIPSANRFGKAKGFIQGIGEGIGRESFIISERGRNHMIHFENVTLI